MTTLQTDKPVAVPQMRQALERRIAHLRSKVRTQMLLEGVARTACVIVAIMIATCIIDWWLELSLAARIIVGLASLAGIGSQAWRTILRPARLALGPVDLASAVDRARKTNGLPRLAPRVASVLQFREPAGRETTSPAMIEAAVSRSFRELEPIDFTTFTDPKHLRACWAVLAGAVILPVLLAIVFPQGSRLWASRWILGSSEPWPRDTSITIAGLESNRLVIPAGEAYSLVASVTDKGTPTQELWLRTRGEDAPAQTVAMTRFAQGDFRFEMPSLRGPVRAWVEGGDARVGPFVIDPIDRPRIASMRLSWVHPSQGKPQSHDFAADSGDAALLPRSQAQLTLTADVPVSQAILSASGGPEKLDRIDEKTFAARWTHEQSVRLRVELVRGDGGLRSHPVSITIGVKEDRPPRVTLRHSGVRQSITPVAAIPLTVGAHDDYGLASITVVPGLSRAATSRPPAPDPPAVPVFGPADPASELSVDARHELGVDGLKLVPGDLLHVSAWASDNHYGGAQTGQSPRLTFRIVSPEELFREILVRQQGLRAAFRKNADAAQEFRAAIVTASLPEGAADLLRRYRLIQRETWRIGQQLGASAEEMRLNKLGGPEAHELIQRTVIVPLRTLHDQPMTTQRQEIQALKGSDPERVTKLLERQDEIVADMEKILQAMNQWDSFIDVVNQLNEIIRLQEKVRSETQKLRDRKADSIFDK